MCFFMRIGFVCTLSVHSCCYEKQLCGGGGETDQRTCLVWSVLSVVFIRSMFVSFVSSLVYCTACRIAFKEVREGARFFIFLYVCREQLAYLVPVIAQHNGMAFYYYYFLSTWCNVYIIINIIAARVVVTTELESLRIENSADTGCAGCRRVEITVQCEERTQTRQRPDGGGTTTIILQARGFFLTPVGVFFGLRLIFFGIFASLLVLCVCFPQIKPFFVPNDTAHARADSSSQRDTNYVVTDLEKNQNNRI